jgi:microcystin degradation protein MlrC
MKVLVAECKQEISSFNPQLSTYDDFVVSFGQDLTEYHKHVRNEVGGALHVFQESDKIEVIPAYSARMNTSGGTLSAAGFRRLAGEFLDAVKAAPQVDGVYFALHGAMAAENEPDTEGFLLAETRALLGPEVPIVASLDLHGILTRRMLEESDALVAFHTYPHVDFFETGQRAARLLLRVLAGTVRPVSARVRIPALVRGDELITETGLFGKFTQRACELEESGAALSAAMLIGNPFTDTPDLSTNALVVTDGDAARAAGEAVELASGFWAVRDRLHSNLTPLDESIRIACQSSGRIVLVDAADAPSSGASGDSNAILRALIEAGCRRTALLPMVDAPAVHQAFAAGVGAYIEVPLGGTVDPTRFQPVHVPGVVRLLFDGRFRSESYGEEWNSGLSAVLQSGPITTLLTSRACNLWDRSLFLAAGQDPASFDIVVVKSPHCQPRFFEAKAERMVNVDAPGATSANLRSLRHTRCPRPIYPLDPDVEFKPCCELFSRGRVG